MTGSRQVIGNEDVNRAISDLKCDLHELIYAPLRGIFHPRTHLSRKKQASKQAYCLGVLPEPFYVPVRIRLIVRAHFARRIDRTKVWFATF